MFSSSATVPSGEIVYLGFEAQSGQTGQLRKPPPMDGISHVHEERVKNTPASLSTSMQRTFSVGKVLRRLAGLVPSISAIPVKYRQGARNDLFDFLNFVSNLALTFHVHFHLHVLDPRSSILDPPQNSRMHCDSHRHETKCHNCPFTWFDPKFFS